jgi:isopentenyldiphosphate isomerase
LIPQLSRKSRNLRLQKEEVEEIRFYHTDFLKTELNKNPGIFVPHGRYWFEIISEVEKRMV